MDGTIIRFGFQQGIKACLVITNLTVIACRRGLTLETGEYDADSFRDRQFQGQDINCTYYNAMLASRPCALPERSLPGFPIM